MLFGAMHIFSRANAERIAIRPKKMPWSKNKSFRLFGSSDLHDRTLISGPLLEPKQQLQQRAQVMQPLPEQLRVIPVEPPPEYSDLTNASPVTPHDFISSTGAASRPWPQDQNTVQNLPSRSATEPTRQRQDLKTREGSAAEAHPGIRMMSRGAQSSRTTATSRQTNSATEDAILNQYAELPSVRSTVEPPAPLFNYGHQRQGSTATSASIRIGLRLSKSFLYMQSPQELPARAYSRLSDTSTLDLEYNSLGFPMRLSDPTAQDLTPLATALTSPTETAMPLSPPKVALIPRLNVGIGALGQGPKFGPKGLAKQPPRASPLRSESKAETAWSEKSGSVSSSYSVTPTSTTSPVEDASLPTINIKSAQNLSPPVVRGLPRSPSPRMRSVSPSPARLGTSPTPSSRPEIPVSPMGTPSPSSSSPSPSPSTRTAPQASQWHIPVYGERAASPSSPTRESPTEWPRWRTSSQA